MEIVICKNGGINFDEYRFLKRNCVIVFFELYMRKSCDVYYRYRKKVTVCGNYMYLYRYMIFLVIYTVSFV